MSVNRQPQRYYFRNIPLQWVMLLSLIVQVIGTIGLIKTLSNQSWTGLIYGIVIVLSIAFIFLLTRSLNQSIIDCTRAESQSELALKQALSQLNYLIENSPLATIRWDQEFRVAYWSKQAEELFGWKAEEVLGKTMYEWRFIFEKDLELVNRAVDKSLGGNYTTCENRNYHKDGSVIHCVWYNSTLVDESGNLISMLSLTQDVSDSKRTEQALRYSEKQLRTFLDNAPTPMTIKDLEGTYLSVNQEFAYSLQLPESEILGKKDYDLFPAENVKNIHTCEMQAIFEGIAVNFEETVELLDGLHTFLVTKFPLMDAQDKPYAVAGIYLDISDRKRAEMMLAYQRDLQDAIYNGSADAIFLVDPLSILTFDCNQRAVAMFEASSKQELIGIEGRTLQKRAFTEEELDVINDEIEIFGIWSLEVEYITKKGKVFWGNLAIKRITVAGKEINLVRVTDISDRKKMEAILKESEARFQKIAIASPEVIYITVRQPDGTTKFEYANVAIEELLGVSLDDLMSKSNIHYEIFHPDDLHTFEQELANSMATLQIFRHEWRIITPQGQIKWIKSQARPEHRENGDVAWYGFAIDISERKQTEISLVEAEANLRKINQELERLINLDGLTQIANRRCFNDRIVIEWQRLHREQKPLSLLMFDVDYFKRYNDLYGHQIGDECLIKIAQAVNHLMRRPADLVARYGGEEFIVILPNTHVSGAIAVADRIHEAIKNLQIPHQDSIVSNIVSISMGIACDIPNLERSPYVLINQVDHALYEAKQQGRNRSVLFAA